MMAVWTTKTNKQAQGKCGRTLEILEDGLVRTVTSDRARTSSSTRALWCRCRPHLKQTFDFKTSICQSCLWESQKTWKVGSFITMKLLPSWWSGSLILVFAWIYRWSSRSVAKSARFSQVPPRGLLPYMAFNEMCLWRAYGFCPLHPEQGIQYHPSLS